MLAGGLQASASCCCVFLGLPLINAGCTLASAALCSGGMLLCFVLVNQALAADV
jgi:hypothetical protein